MSEKSIDRRDFLKGTLLSGVGLGALGASLQAGEEAAGKKDKKEKDADKVPRRELGGTGETIPILLMGCAMKFNPQYDKRLHRAFKEGVDYLDAALVYARGQSHKTLAPFIKQVGRKKLWITSKATTHRNKAMVETFRRDLQTCLQQLETDYLDLFFMHMINHPKYLAKEYLKLGEKLKQEKKIRFFGFSSHAGNVPELMELAAKSKGIDAIMFSYNFGKYGDQKLNRAIDACVKAKIGLIAMKTQKSVPASAEKVVKFKSKNFTLAQAKLKAVWADERITAAVSHMDNLKKLEENIAAAKSPAKLTMDEFMQLNHLAAATAAYSCQGCSHLCESQVGCDVKIADTLRYLMYHESYGLSARARELYQQLNPAERQLAGVDFRAAAAACPQGIDIAARLARARAELA